MAVTQPGYGNSAPLHLDIDTGLVENEGGADALVALIHAHEQAGGTLINMNCISKEKLLKAHEDPKAYPDLVVRVTGLFRFFCFSVQGIQAADRGSFPGGIKEENTGRVRSAPFRSSLLQSAFCADRREMGIMNAEWRDRVKHWLRTLKDDFYEPLEELAWEAFPTMEYLTQEEALQGAFEPVKPGFTWGKTYEYCWFKGSLTLPERAAGERIVMNLQPGGESTLFVNGKAFGTYRASWVDQPHQSWKTISLQCPAGRENVCDPDGNLCRALLPGIAHRRAAVPGLCCPVRYTDPNGGGEMHAGLCTFGIWNETAYQLFMDADTLNRLFAVLDENSLRAAKIAKALEQFTLTVDFEQGREERIHSYEKAREELQPLLKAENGSTAPCFYAIGNAHLDLAWLWPMAETYRKTERTFAAQLRCWRNIRNINSCRASRLPMKCAAKIIRSCSNGSGCHPKGRWIAEGAMWVEPDTNMAGGEALIRQLVHGKRYYKEVLGTESEVLWLPDTFGYTAALPQILKAAA